MKLSIVIVGIVAVHLYGQTISLTGPAGMQKAGTSASLALSIAGSSGIQAIQFSLPAAFLQISSADGAALSGLGKTLTCALIGVKYNCVVAGGASALADGQIVVIQVAIPKNAAG